MKKLLLCLIVYLIIPTNVYAVKSTSIYFWNKAVNSKEIYNNLVNSNSKADFSDIYGTKNEANTCSVASLARLLFDHNKINQHQYDTLKEFEKTITTVDTQEKIITCRFNIPFEDLSTEPIYFYYDIYKGKKYNFNLKYADNAPSSTNILWSMAPWLLNIEQIEYLLDNGANPNVRYKYESIDNWTFTESTLGRYTAFTNSKIVKKLLKHKAEPDKTVELGSNSKDNAQSYAWTPLMIAINKEDKDIVKVLLSKGANPDFNIRVADRKDKKVNHPMLLAVYNPDILKLLIKYGGNVNEWIPVSEDAVITPLVGAMLSTNTVSVELLLSKGANPAVVAGIKGTTGVSALWWLLENKQNLKNTEAVVEVAKTLLKHKVNCNQFYKGETPLSFAKKNIPELVPLLQKYGAKEYTEDMVEATVTSARVELTEDKICYNKYGSRRICGVVANNTQKTVNVAIFFNLYDKDGFLIGNTLDTVSNLEPQSKWKFEAPVTDSSMTKYKLKELRVY